MSPRLEPNSNPFARCLPHTVVGHAQRFVRIIFFHHSAADIELCQHELHRMRFSASSEVVLTRELLAERLRVGSYDAIVAEYPGSCGQERPMLDLLRQIGKVSPSCS
jgi:hypothetical protein